MIQLKNKVKIIKKYYFIYKTTNIINNKFYLGMHSTNDLHDNYLGSGTILKNSIKKYGKENFKKEILEFANSKDELIIKEKILINDELIKNPLCMNIKLGGGSHYVITIPWTIERKEQQSENMLGNKNPMYGKERTTIERNKISLNHVDVNGSNNPMYGKTHTTEVKNKLKLLQSERNKLPHLCKYCNRIICGKSNFTRFHNDNCKLKPIT